MTTQKNKIPVSIDHPVNLLSSQSYFEGKLVLNEYSHFNGEIKGELVSNIDSTIVIGEQGVVEGKIIGDIVLIDGFVRGEVVGKTKVVISETGRVIGKIKTPNFSITFGGYFDGQSTGLVNDVFTPKESLTKTDQV